MHLSDARQVRLSLRTTSADGVASAFVAAAAKRIFAAQERRVGFAPLVEMRARQGGHRLRLERL